MTDRCTKSGRKWSGSTISEYDSDSSCVQATYAWCESTHQCELYADHRCKRNFANVQTESSS